MFEEYRDRVGELITGIVQQSDSRYTLVQLRERVEALLPKSEQVDGERYDHSQRIKAVIKEVSPSTKGPSIIVSRRDPELIKKLFELEVPEIADGLVEIANVAREPGYRSKIAVVSLRRRRRPGRRLRRPARLARAHGRLRAARREDRHHPLQRRARPLRRQGALARARARGARRRRRPPGDRRRPRRPALAGHRPRGPERAPRRPPDRLAHRHQVRDRVRHRGARRAATRRRRPAGAAPRSWATAAAAPTRRCPARASAASTAHQALEGTGTDYVAGEPPAERSPRTARSRRPSPRRRSPRAWRQTLVEEALARGRAEDGRRRRRARARPRGGRARRDRRRRAADARARRGAQPHSGARARPRTPLHRLRPPRAQGAPPPPRLSRRPRRRRSRRDAARARRVHLRCGLPRRAIERRALGRAFRRSVPV